MPENSPVMCMMNHRLQILLDDDRYQRITALATQRHTSVASIIREAIDRGLPSATRRRTAAADRILAAAAMPVDDVLGELDELRGRHA